MARKRDAGLAEKAAGVDLLLLAVTLVWGMNFSVMKSAYATFHPFAFTFLRFLVASATLTAILAWKRIDLRVERRDLPALIGMGFLSNTLYQVLFVQGLALTRAGNAALLMASTPIFAYLFGLFLKREAFSRRVLTGLALSAAGVALIVFVGNQRVELGADWRGDAMILASAVCWGWYSAGTARLVVRYGSLSVTYWLMIVGTVLLIPILLPSALRQDWASITASAWLALGYSTMLSIVFCYVVWAYALGRVGVSRTAVYSNLTPVIALLGGWVLLGERPFAAQLLGAGMIMLGILLVRSRRSR